MPHNHQKFSPCLGEARVGERALNKSGLLSPTLSSSEEEREKMPGEQGRVVVPARFAAQEFFLPSTIKLSTII